MRDVKSIAPSNKEAMQAEKSGRILADYIKSTKTPTLALIGKKERKDLELPAPVLDLLLVVLHEMGQGNTVSLVPLERELTTQQAADFLNVSRPYFVKLLEENKIPHHKIGTKRRILAKDVLHYKNVMRKKRLKTLAALTKQAQKLDMGY